MELPKSIEVTEDTNAHQADLLPRIKEAVTQYCHWIQEVLVSCKDLLLLAECGIVPSVSFTGETRF